MSRETEHARRRKPARKETDVRRASDGAIYGGFLMIGLFAVLLSIPLTEARYWQWVVVIYLALMAYLVNLYAYRAYRGGQLFNWQAALARLPLRFAGFGGGAAKPLEAARGQPRARTAVLISMVVSVVVIAVLAVLLVPGLRPW